MPGGLSNMLQPPYTKQCHFEVENIYFYMSGLSHMLIGSGGSRNLERGVQPRAHEAHPKLFGLPRPLPVINAFVTHIIIVATHW